MRPYERWLNQAWDDLQFARLGLEQGFHAQACWETWLFHDDDDRSGPTSAVVGDSPPAAQPGTGSARVFLEERTARDFSFLTRRTLSS